MATRLHSLLKLAVIVPLLLAASGGDYYYAAASLPGRGAQPDDERRAERLRIYGRQRAEAVRVLAERQQAQERRATDKAAVDGRYETCLTGATTTHDASWDAACKRLADQAEQDRADCLANTKLPQGYCAAAYRARDASPHCVLPVKVSAVLDSDLTHARDQCLQQRNAALQ